METSTGLNITASSIGRIASEVISLGGNGWVQGITSQGVFIHTNITATSTTGAQWVLFISTGMEKGPITVLIPPTLPLPPIARFSPVLIQDSCLHFPQEKLTINTRPAVIWSAPPLHPAPNLSLPLIQDRVFSVWDLLIHTGLPEELLALNHHNPCTPPCSFLLEGAPLSVDELPRRLAGFLGTGGGLTPVGDDLVMGFLLFINSCETAFPLPASSHEHVSAGIVESAYQKTTTLSANLIECAAMGEAPESILIPIQHIFSGVHTVEQTVSAIRAWGHSSGVAVFAGMKLGLDYLVLLYTPDEPLE